MEAGDFGKIFEEVRVLFNDGHVGAVDGGDLDRFETPLLLAQEDPIIDRKRFPILPTVLHQNLERLVPLEGVQKTEIGRLTVTDEIRKS